MNRVVKLLTVSVLGLLSPWVLADMAGTYVSEDQCKLTVEQLSDDAGYADGVYQLRSDGTGSCEWTGIGVSKSTYVDAGIISGSSRAFAEMHWVYGPAGNKVEVTFYDTDGAMRYKQAYTRD